MKRIKDHWQMTLITLLIFALWTTPVATPLKILIVFFHEISHGLAGVMTGGSIENITFSPQQGGQAWIRGGNPFAVSTAGYLGSLGIGVFLFLIALKSTWDKVFMGILGVVLVAISALYVRDGFALAFGLGTGAVMIAVARYLPKELNDLLLRVIGLTSMIYVPYDIFDDTIARASERSDAFMLAEQFGGTAMIWGVIWLLISIVVIIACLRYGVRNPSNIYYKSIS